MAYNVERVRFLVVDDHPPMAMQIRQLLRGLGARHIATAANGEEGIGQVAAFKPHIVLTDFRMEPVTGLQLARWIRTSPESPDQEMAIIMTSAYSEPARVIAARDAGVNEFLVKPISIGRLNRRIEAVIESERPFIRSPSYVGPCRRRGQHPHYAGPFRRSDDVQPDAVEAAAAATADMEEAELDI